MVICRGSRRAWLWTNWSILRLLLTSHHLKFSMAQEEFLISSASFTSFLVHCGEYNLPMYRLAPYSGSFDADISLGPHIQAVFNSGKLFWHDTSKYHLSNTFLQLKFLSRFLSSHVLIKATSSPFISIQNAAAKAVLLSHCFDYVTFLLPSTGPPFPITWNINSCFHLQRTFTLILLVS